MSESMKNKKAVIKEGLVELTGDYKKAIILNQFIYWSERIRDFDKFIKEENSREDIEEDLELRNGWIFKSAKKLAKETMLEFSSATMRKHIKYLRENDWISERRNPDYKWDQTKQYRVNIRKIQSDLLKIGYSLEEYRVNLDEDSILNSKVQPEESKNQSKESKNQTSKIKNTIPETTNTETTKTKTKKEKKDIRKKRIETVFNHWVNRDSTVSHKKLTNKMKNRIDDRLDDGFSIKELKKAINNYNTVLREDIYYWTYVWNLDEFMGRSDGAKMEKFLYGIEWCKDEDKVKEKKEEERKRRAEKKREEAQKYKDRVANQPSYEERQKMKG